MENISISLLGDLPIEQQESIANQVAEYSAEHAEKQLIVPVDAQTVLAKRLALAAMDRDILAGFVGATDIHELCAQIGTLMVPKPYEGRGIGYTLVNEITQLTVAEEKTAFAFCNPSSKPAFAAAGYGEMPAKSLPEGATSPYGNQPMVYLG